MTTPHILTMHQSAKHLAKTQNELLISVFIKATADSFVSVYVPIFLIIHGVSLQHVMLYCMFVFTSAFVSTQIALKLNQFIGVKKVLTVGIIFTASFYYCLHSLIPATSYLMIGLVDGLAIGFYFGSYNMLLTKAMSRSREGKGYTLQQIVGLTAGVFGPLIGSICIKQLSFQDLFLIVIGILALSPLPLFFNKDYRAPREPLQLSTILEGSKARRRVDRSVFLQGILYGAGTIWPLYLYLHYPHILILGVLTSASAALVILSTYLIGRSVDRHQRMAYGFGSLLYAPTWLTRLLFVTPLGLTINAFAASVLAIAPTMAVSKDIFHVAKLSKNRAAHFSRIEFYMDFGRITIFTVAFLAGNLTAMFLISAIAALGYVSCRPKRGLQPARVVV